MVKGTGKERPGAGQGGRTRFFRAPCPALRLDSHPQVAPAHDSGAHDQPTAQEVPASTHSALTAAGSSCRFGSTQLLIAESDQSLACSRCRARGEAPRTVTARGARRVPPEHNILWNSRVRLADVLPRTLSIVQAGWPGRCVARWLAGPRSWRSGLSTTPLARIRRTRAARRRLPRARPGGQACIILPSTSSYRRPSSSPLARSPLQLRRLHPLPPFPRSTARLADFGPGTPDRWAARRSATPSTPRRSSCRTGAQRPTRTAGTMVRCSGLAALGSRWKLKLTSCLLQPSGAVSLEVSRAAWCVRLAQPVDGSSSGRPRR